MPSTTFHNYATHTDEPVAVEQKGDSWYILPGFAGFNSTANNLWGYGSKAAAESAINHYQSAQRNKR